MQISDAVRSGLAEMLIAAGGGGGGGCLHSRQCEKRQNVLHCGRPDIQPEEGSNKAAEPSVRTEKDGWLQR